MLKFVIILKLLLVVTWVHAEVGDWPAGILLNKEERIFYVDKSKRELKLYDFGARPQLLLSESADIGKKQGDKQKANDHRTPEGIYFLLKRLSPPEIPFELYGSLAFTSDYPNYFDRLIGKTGNGIWLHAVPDTVPLTRGSRGCVVVNNQAIQNLESYVQLDKSAMVINAEATYLTPEEAEKQKTEILSALDKWRQVWQAQQLDEYFNYYHADFVGSGMDKNQWIKHKTKLKATYTGISVEFEPTLILRRADQVVLRFKQNYRADQYQDVGEKTIYAYWRNQTLQILNESWRKL